ncbi:hypothetical protein BZA77DRAFT_251144 [Pyronema omphalodes]|nr:hypothetical protein BZA77DRAFT_251144 [Pyronema omphalodes]
MELGHRAVGPFYYRPMDQVLHRITDFPARSQPLMYIDLAVIRETSITHRQTHYHYFSYRWHQELVKKGLANEPWSTASKKKKGSKNLSQSEEVPCKELLLDSFGFPKTDPTRLFKIDGTATLQDCHILVTEKENIITNIPSSKWTIATGSYGNGRPRKYEKGKEPYLEGKRRREQREREILEAIERGEIPPYTSADGRARGKRKAEVLGDMNGGEEMLKRPRAPITRSLRKRKAATSPPRQLETPVKRGRAAGKKQDKDKQQEKQKQLEKQKEQKEQKEQEKEKQQEKQKDAQDTEDAEDAATTATAATTAMDTAMEIDLLKDMDKDGNEDRDVVMVDTEIVTGGLRSSGEDKGLENNEAGEGNAGGDMDVDEAGTGDKGVDRGDDKEAPPSSQPDAPFAVDDVVVEPDNLAADHESYGSIGGMLALGRQQIVLDLVSTHHGVFPGGNELRHAFNYEYRKKNPKAGEADRRLIRGVVQALQYKGKINQFSFTIQTARGVMVKKLLVAKEVSIDHPLVIEAIRQMKAADCNLWYPEGTDLPPSVQARVGTSVTWVQAPPSAVEETEFDRMYPSLTQTKKTEKATARAIKNQQKAEDRKMRAELKRMKQLGGTLSTWSGKFTEEQRQEALRRKSELKIKIEKLRTKFANPAVEESEEEPSGPRTIWWNDFVQRPPPDANAFLKDVEDVNNVELMQGEELFDSSQTKNGKLVMINHFGPAIETKGNNKPMSLDNQISKKLNKDGSQHLSPNKKASAAAQNTPTTSAEALMEDPSKPQKKRRKRPAGSKAPTNSRRQKAMEELHKVTGLEAIADEQSELPNRTVWTHRNKYTIPREDEDTLLIAVIIVRTLFGNIDRKINWNLIQKAMPQHDTIVFQRRWPRVREMHKTHLKRLQTEFEEMYLQAYAEGHLPRLDMDHPMEFDIRWHIKWFRDNLELPE